MALVALISYGLVNVVMVLSYLGGRGRFYQFPFWVGLLSLGWFFPQAIGGYAHVSTYPENAFEAGMFFASLCTIALWVGFELSVVRPPPESSWLNASFDLNKLFFAGAALCLFGYFFEWKLQSLPDEMLSNTQWTGAPVKYLFLSNVFKIGFIVLCLLYLSQSRLFVPRLLLFIVPGLLLLLKAAVLWGRRAAMMDLVSYFFISLWFARRMALPRWFVITGTACGLILISSIGTYRSIMANKEVPLKERLQAAAQADYLKDASGRAVDSGFEFDNYIYYRKTHVDVGYYDFGGIHWNIFVHNYVPGQLLGREFKDSLKIGGVNIFKFAKIRYNHSFKLGTTSTGYLDAFGSFGWFGFIKFALIGCIMGGVYRHAMNGAFLGQLLYIYFLAKAMHCVSHGTNDILVRMWVYFFVLGYPLLKWAQRPVDMSTQLK